MEKISVGELNFVHVEIFGTAVRFRVWIEKWNCRCAERRLQFTEV